MKFAEPITTRVSTPGGVLRFSEKKTTAIIILASGLSAQAAEASRPTMIASTSQRSTKSTDPSRFNLLRVCSKPRRNVTSMFRSNRWI